MTTYHFVIANGRETSEHEVDNDYGRPICIIERQVLKKNGEL